MRATRRTSRREARAAQRRQHEFLREREKQQAEYEAEKKRRLEARLRGDPPAGSAAHRRQGIEEAPKAEGPSGPNAEMWDVFYAFELKRNEVAMAGLKAQRDFLSHERTRLGEIVRHARGLLQGKRI